MTTGLRSQRDTCARYRAGLGNSMPNRELIPSTKYSSQPDSTIDQRTATAALASEDT
jgi:hypothetical protein